MIISRSHSAYSTTNWRSTRWKLHTPRSCGAMSHTLSTSAALPLHGHSQRTIGSTLKSSRMSSAVFFSPHVSYRPARHHYHQPRRRPHRRSPHLTFIEQNLRAHLSHPFRCSSRYLGTVGRTRAHYARHLLPRCAPRRAPIEHERARRHPVQDDCASPHSFFFLFLLLSACAHRLAQSEADLTEDEHVVGFKIISTDDLDDFGIDEVIRRIRARIGDNPVYLRRV
jgi:hypothetical protein